MSAIRVAVDLLLAGEMLKYGLKGLELMAKNPRKAIAYSENEGSINTRKAIYQLLDLEFKDNYPEIIIFLVPALWVYNRNADNINSMIDIAIAPKISLGHEPGLVKGDNICFMDMFGTTDYVDQRPKAIEEIMKVVKNSMENDPKYLKSQLEECRKTIAELNDKIGRLRASKDMNDEIAIRRITELEDKYSAQKEVIMEFNSRHEALKAVLL